MQKNLLPNTETLANFWQQDSLEMIVLWWWQEGRLPVHSL